MEAQSIIIKANRGSRGNRRSNVLIPGLYHTVVVGTVKDDTGSDFCKDQDLLRRQHECLIRIFKELNLRVIQVDLYGSYVTHFQVDNIAVACNGTVFLPKPRTVVDQKNASILKKVFTSDCTQIVVEQKNPEANVCGSDVLFTGEEILVGVCDTTNAAGANELAEAFPDFSVTAFTMPSGAEHIKDYVTLVGDMTLAVGPSDLAKAIMAKIKRVSARVYTVIDVAEDTAANCLFVNQTLIHQAIEEIPESFKIFIEQSRHSRRSICFSEVTKLRGGLTSVCVLTKKDNTANRYLQCSSCLSVFHHNYVRLTPGFHFGMYDEDWQCLPCRDPTSSSNKRGVKTRAEKLHKSTSETACATNTESRPISDAGKSNDSSLIAEFRNLCQEFQEHKSCISDGIDKCLEMMNSFDERICAVDEKVTIIFALQAKVAQLQDQLAHQS